MNIHKHAHTYACTHIQSSPTAPGLHSDFEGWLFSLYPSCFVISLPGSYLAGVHGYLGRQGLCRASSCPPLSPLQHLTSLCETVSCPTSLILAQSQIIFLALVGCAFSPFTSFQAGHLYWYHQLSLGFSPSTPNLTSLLQWSTCEDCQGFTDMLSHLRNYRGQGGKGDGPRQEYHNLPLEF